MCLREKIGPDPRNFNQRVSLGRNDLLIRTFLNCNRRARNSGASANARIKRRDMLKVLIFLNKFRFPRQDIVNVAELYNGNFDTIPALYDTKGLA